MVLWGVVFASNMVLIVIQTEPDRTSSIDGRGQARCCKNRWDCTFCVREHICIDEPRQVDSSKRLLSLVQHEYFWKNVSEREMTSNTKLWCGSWMEISRCFVHSTHLRPVSTAEQTLCSLRDGEARTFQQVVQELPERNFVDLVGPPSPVEEDFEEPMNVASSDKELHEDFPSGEGFSSAPDDSEVSSGPQMTYQTRSTSSHAETPAAVPPEPTQAPFIPKVEQSSSTARPSVIQPPTSTVIDVATINDTTDGLTITYGIISRTNVSVSSHEASFATNSAGV